VGKFDYLLDDNWSEIASLLNTTDETFYSDCFTDDILLDGKIT
jgi:hypothetical protein